MTVVEQLNAKVGGKLLSPSDILSLASFVRKLVVNLGAKVLDLTLLQSITQRVDEILSEDRLFLKYPVLSTAIRREVRILKASLSGLLDVRSDRSSEDLVVVSEEVTEYLTEIIWQTLNEQKHPPPLRELTLHMN